MTSKKPKASAAAVAPTLFLTQAQRDGIVAESLARADWLDGALADSALHANLEALCRCEACMGVCYSSEHY